MAHKQAHILLVEDEEAHVELIRRAFESGNDSISLQVVRNLRQARASLKKSLPDLTIIDLLLPDGKGTELLHNGLPESHPIIIMTSHGDEQVAVEAIKSGALDYVVKSEATFADMPHIVNRALREWEHIRRRQRAEQALEQSRERLALVFDNVSDALNFVALEPDGGFRSLLVNKAFEKLSGFKAEEIVGKPVQQVLSKEEFAYMLENCKKAIATRRKVKGEKVFELSGGTRVIEAEVFPIFNGKDECTHLLFVSRDVTEKKEAEAERERLEAQLRHAQKMETIGTLAGGIAHDFNNLLSPILGYTDLALRTLPESSQIRQDLNQVLNAANRARDLVQRILTFSRQVENEKKTVRLQPIVKEALKLLRATLPRTIEIETQIDEECEPVFADASQIHQVLMNLCTNAYHAMGEDGGILRVSLRMAALGRETASLQPDLPPGRYVVIEVTDSGHGMNPETLDRAFEPFFTTKATGEGTGLGLSMVHGIVVSHGGGVTAESSEDCGSTFKVYLPVAQPDEKADSKADTTNVSGTERIMFVDDDEGVAFVGKRILESMGYTVTVMTDSVEALAKLQKEPQCVDLLITDQTMPRLVGTKLGQAVKQIRPDLPIILTTGYTNAFSHENVKNCGIVATIMKPYEVRELGKLVREVLDR